MTQRRSTRTADPVITTCDAPPNAFCTAKETAGLGVRFPSWLRAIAVLGLASISAGCSAALAPVAAVSGPFQGLSHQLAYNETVDETVLGWRNRVWAWQAWQARKHHFAHHPHFHDFGRGFRDGYRDAASGGDGCVPPLPPRRYWSWRYNSLDGQGQIQAWFEGYPHGVQAAEEDGVTFYGHIPVSHAAEVVHQQHHPHAGLYESPLWRPAPNPELQSLPPVEVLPPETLREAPLPEKSAPMSDFGPGVPLYPPPHLPTQTVPAELHHPHDQEYPVPIGGNLPATGVRLVNHLAPPAPGESHHRNENGAPAQANFAEHIPSGEKGWLVENDWPSSDESATPPVQPWSQAAAAAEDFAQRIRGKWTVFADSFRSDQ